MNVATKAVSSSKKGIIIALKIFGTVAIAILSAGIVFALAARYQIPFISPPADGEEGSAEVLTMTALSLGVVGVVALYAGATLLFVGQ